MALLLDDFKHFLSTSPTSWHAAENMGIRLAMHDFSPLSMQEPWDLERGKGYFVKMGGMLIAFTLPTQKLDKVLLAASHTDSPALKLKPQPEVIKENMRFLSVEVYGSPILSSWLNRDLGIAGRVIAKDAKGSLHEHLVFIDDSPLIIPQLAIHLDREVNDKLTGLSRQNHLLALGSIFEEKEEEGYLDILLKRHLPYYKFLSHDLFLVPLEEPRFLGYANELIASYRIDNLASSHAILSAFASAAKPLENAMQMAIFYDHEEIGSRSTEGATSPILNETLQRIAAFYNLSQEDFQCVKHQSLCLSVDMAHAFHPSYSEKYDAQHKVLPGHGIVIKTNADKKYATDALTASYVIELCNKASITYQYFTTHSDLPCGSTVGPFIAQTCGIKTVDIGAPQFSMHSSRELMACKDYLDLYQMLNYYFQDTSVGG